jgi:hypothetical protein
LGSRGSKNESHFLVPLPQSPDANISELIYEGSTLPPPMKDTQIVALKVCDRYGLQQVRWESRIFTLCAAVDKFWTISSTRLPP